MSTETIAFFIGYAIFAPIGAWIGMSLATRHDRRKRRREEERRRRNEKPMTIVIGDSRTMYMPGVDTKGIAE